MKEHMTLGPTPGDEECAQVGAIDYNERSRAECKRYKALLEKRFPPKGDAYFAIKSFPHDFGSYREVVVCFDPDVEEEVTFAYDVEANLPATWD